MLQQGPVRTLRKERPAGDTTQLEDYAAAAEDVNRAYKHLASPSTFLPFRVMQQGAVRTLRKERPAGDTTKLEDYAAAAEDLDKACSSFVHLKRLPPARSGIDMKKLDAHIEFCSSTYAKAQACAVGVRLWDAAPHDTWMG